MESGGEVPKKPELQSRLRPTPFTGRTPDFAPGPSAFGTATTAGPAAPTHLAGARGGLGKPRPRDGGRTAGPLHGWSVPLEAMWAWEVGFTEGTKGSKRSWAEWGSQSSPLPTSLWHKAALLFVYFHKGNALGLARPRVPNLAWRSAFGNAAHT